MRTFLVTAFLFTSPLFCENASPQVEKPHYPFTNFTGKVTKNKVRLRLQPSLDAPVIKTLTRGDMLIVAGETEEFYSVLPQEDMKAYIFRTFVLDNKVEGSHVNVRLEPNTDAPTVAQLNTGDYIEGRISSLNSKWLEIPIPASARFFIAKEYVEKVGDATLMATLNKKREDINITLSSAYNASQHELSKEFPDIKLDAIIKKYQWVAEQGEDFPDQAARSKELLASLQETYLQKKIAYLENKANQAPVYVTVEPAQSPSRPAVTPKMSAWNEYENMLFAEWQKNNPELTLNDYKSEERENTKRLRGLIEPYVRSIKNKPGDYVLVNPINRSIMAYLYSNIINLQDWVDQEITIKAVPRPNNHFAFPAYYVVEID